MTFLDAFIYIMFLLSLANLVWATLHFFVDRHIERVRTEQYNRRVLASIQHRWNTNTHY